MTTPSRINEILHFQDLANLVDLDSNHSDSTPQARGGSKKLPAVPAGSDTDTKRLGKPANSIP